MHAIAATRHSDKPRRYLITLLCLLPLIYNVNSRLSAADTAAQSHEIPSIAIIIDDIGNVEDLGLRAVLLPGAVTISILPQTPHSVPLARMANRMRKEVMLHLPLQSIHKLALGPGGMTLDMSFEDFFSTFERDVRAIPFVAGVNNHMGSLLTQHAGFITWLMQAMSTQTHLYFVDSFTTPHSVVSQIAAEHWVPAVKRDVFLDNIPSQQHINIQFDQLLSLARRNGIALAIGHPYPQTLHVLRQRLSNLSETGVKLVPVSELVELSMRRIDTWRAYLSP